MSENKTLRSIYENVVTLIIAVGISLFIGSIIGIATVDGDSMNNTISHNQRLFVNKIAYLTKNSVEREDIVIVENPLTEGETLIKRIIGLPGDKFEIKNNTIYVNNEKIHEPYIKEPMIDNPHIFIEEIPEDKYFILGDNRNNSGDSRDIGLIDKKEIVGKAYVRQK